MLYPNYDVGARDEARVVPQREWPAGESYAAVSVVVTLKPSASIRRWSRFASMAGSWRVLKYSAPGST
ncbi:MAG: hypothetical protein ABSG36_19225 [Acidimicrobiales bacterium]|jgi:hypothetical protein